MIVEQSRGVPRLRRGAPERWGSGGHVRRVLAPLGAPRKIDGGTDPRLSFQRGASTAESPALTDGESEALRPLRAAAWSQLLRRGHAPRDPGSGDRDGDRSGDGRRRRPAPGDRRGRSPHAGGGAVACRRGHDGRGAGARVLASAGAGDVGGAPREGRRGRDRQESLRVSRRGRMTEPRSDGEIAALVSRLLHELVGDDAIREGLARTPERVEKALRYLTSGYDKDVKDVLNDALFVEEYD